MADLVLGDLVALVVEALLASSQSFSMIQRRILDGPDPASPEKSGEPLKTTAILEPTRSSSPSA
jgi:hypothetical protein